MHFFDRYCLFVGGLSWLAATALVLRGPRSDRAARSAIWIVVLSAAQGCLAWTELWAECRGGTGLCRTVQLVAWIATVVGAVELGQTVWPAPCRWLLPRWGYGPVALVAALSLVLGTLSLWDYEYRAIVAWQGLGIVYSFFVAAAERNRQKSVAEKESELGEGVASTLRARETRVGKPRGRAPKRCDAANARHSDLLPASPVPRSAQHALAVAVLGVIAGVVAHLPILTAPAAFALAAVAWQSDMLASTGGRRGAAACHWIAAALFAVVAVGGCWLLHRAAADSLTLDQIAASMNALEHAGDGGEYGDAESEHSFAARLARCGMALIPILIFVVIIGALSRLPFVR